MDYMISNMWLGKMINSWFFKRYRWCQLRSKQKNFMQYGWVCFCFL